VAFYLLVCLRKKLRDINFWKNRPEPNLKRFCDLIALGTLADMAPLVSENRILVDMIFGLSPRLNSAGRLDHASIAVELLTTKKREAADQMVRDLDNMNKKRRDIENDIFAQIERHLYQNAHLFQKKTWVLMDGTWHLGVLGIVATRLMRKYFRPVVLAGHINERNRKRFREKYSGRKSV